MGRDARRGYSTSDVAVLSREEKEQKFGMTDLWDPAKRTHMCASCHVGNSAEGKVVTHAMYAAGHPPLPSFEVATFSEPCRGTGNICKEKPEAAEAAQVRSDAKWRRRSSSSCGGTASCAKPSACSTRRGARGRKIPRNKCLDLAQFDCCSCHHDLKMQSWRQRRGYSGTPGRPSMRGWPTVLARLGGSDRGRGAGAGQASGGAHSRLRRPAVRQG